MTATTPTITPTRFVNGEAMQLAGTEKRYTFATMPDIPAQWQQFPVPEGKVAYGVITNAPGGEGFDYMVAVATSDLDAIPADFVRKEIPAQRYAVFAHDGHVSTMCETFDVIFRIWLPSSGLELTHRPDSLERYGERFDPESGTGDTEIWVPVTG